VVHYKKKRCYAAEVVFGSDFAYLSMMSASLELGILPVR